MSTQKSPDTYAAPALVKGLEILEFLATSHEPVTPTEMARALGRSSGEQFRMLAVLQQLGYIRRDSSGAFSPTLKLFCLGQQTRPVEQLLQVARGPMRRYSEATGQECHLSTIEDGRLVVLAQQSGAQAVTVYVRPGSAHHPAHTISGRLLLAQLCGEELNWHLRRASEQFSEKMPGGAALKKGLDEMNGHAIGRAMNESMKGIADIGIRLAGPCSGLHVVLASSWLHTALDKVKQEILERRLREAVERIERELGASSPAQ